VLVEGKIKALRSAGLAKFSTRQLSGTGKFEHVNRRAGSAKVSPWELKRDSEQREKKKGTVRRNLQQRNKVDYEGNVGETYLLRFGKRGGWSKRWERARRTIKQERKEGE